MYLYRYSIDKDDDAEEFSLNLLFEFELEGDITAFNLLYDTKVPIPLCNENAMLILPGDGSINGFIRAVGENVGQSALEVVLRQLGIEVNEQYCFGFECL